MYVFGVSFWGSLVCFRKCFIGQKERFKTQNVRDMKAKNVTSSLLVIFKGIFP